MTMKQITFLVLLSTIIISGCINPGIYGDNPFGNIGLDVENPDSVKIVVEYVDNGAIIKGVITGDNVFSTTGQIIFNKEEFELGYKQLSNLMCKYNPETNKVACASTTPAMKGDAFEFRLVAKKELNAGKYQFSFIIDEINTATINEEYDITVNVK